MGPMSNLGLMKGSLKCKPPATTMHTSGTVSQKNMLCWCLVTFLNTYEGSLAAVRVVLPSKQTLWLIIYVYRDLNDLIWCCSQDLFGFLRVCLHPSWIFFAFLLLLEFLFFSREDYCFLYSPHVSCITQRFCLMFAKIPASSLASIKLRSTVFITGSCHSD